MGRWYSKAVHRRWRKLVMQKDNWLCQECLRRGKITPATEAHHKIPIKERPDLALDVNNGEGLCWRCHRQHHIEEQQKEKERKKADTRRGANHQGIAPYPQKRKNAVWIPRVHLPSRRARSTARV